MFGIDLVHSGYYLSEENLNRVKGFLSHTVTRIISVRFLMFCVRSMSPIYMTKLTIGIY